MALITRICAQVFIVVISECHEGISSDFQVLTFVMIMTTLVVVTGSDLEKYQVAAQNELDYTVAKKV